MVHTNNESRVELLAPAKNFMAIKASGPYADAVYFGAQDFNMRMEADNFSLDQLPKVTEMCHHPQDSRFRVRKAYLTTNILVYEDELGKLEKTIRAAKEAHIDAVIVHDFATIQIAKKIGIPFHVSTQCNVSNSITAQFYEQLGAQRIILAREVSLAQIPEIARKLTTAQIETFVHGAMCSSISGRCYLSQTIYCSEKRSANRGRCAQPCRGEWKLIGPSLDGSEGTELIYDGQRIFNSRDLCMILHIPELIQAGVRGFKIEGRMRHPHYVEVVSRVYREAIEAYYNGSFEEQKTKGWVTQLKRVYNRGFTTGFYFNQATIADSQLHSPANVSHYRYIEMGRILEYYPKSHAAKILLNNGQLRLGDEIIVMSTDPKYDTYFTQKITDLQQNGQKLEFSAQGSEQNPIEISLIMENPVNEKKIDVIYKFTDETYQKTKEKAYPKSKKARYRL
jgi:putative protease